MRRFMGVARPGPLAGPQRSFVQQAAAQIESLFDRPIVAVNDLQKTGTTYAAASSLVSRLVELSVLSEMTGYARNRRFRYARYIALFN